MENENQMPEQETPQPENSQEEQTSPSMEQPSETSLNKPKKRNKTAIIVAVGLVVVVGTAAVFLGGGELFQGKLQLQPVNTSTSVTPINIEIEEATQTPEDQNVLKFAQYIPLPLLPESQEADSPPLVETLELPPINIMTCNISDDVLALEGNDEVSMNCKLQSQADGTLCSRCRRNNLYKGTIKDCNKSEGPDSYNECTCRIKLIPMEW